MKSFTEEEFVDAMVFSSFIAIWKYEHDTKNRTAEDRRGCVKKLGLLVAERLKAHNQPLTPQLKEALTDLGLLKFQ